MFEKIKGKTVISWGGYDYLADKLEELIKRVDLKYIYADKKYVRVTGYEFIEPDDITSLENPFVIISQTKAEDVTKAAAWCKNNNIPFTHLQFVINDFNCDAGYIRAFGGEYTDLNNNVIHIDPGTRGRITLDIRRATNASVTIGKVKIIDHFQIDMWGDAGTFHLGSGALILNANALVNTKGSIEIGDDCMISHHVSVMQSDQHMIFDMISKKRINYSKPIKIGNHVWLGRESRILGGAVIGDGCVVGSGAYTSGKFPSNVIIAGCPAKIIREGIIWAKDEIRFADYDFFSECEDQSALKYLND